MRVRIFMSENIPFVVDWYYWRPYTKLSGAKSVNEPCYYAVYIYDLYFYTNTHLFLFQTSYDINMGKAVSLSPNERQLIMQKLGEGLKPCQIAKDLNRDSRAI